MRCSLDIKVEISSGQLLYKSLIQEEIEIHSQFIDGILSMGVYEVNLREIEN